MRTKFYTALFLRKLRRCVDAGELYAASQVAKDVRANIDTPGPPHSTVGDYPHTVTGELLESVEHGRGDDGAFVKASAPHAEIAEANRPFLRRTLMERGSAKITRDVVKGAQSAGMVK